MKFKARICDYCWNTFIPLNGYQKRCSPQCCAAKGRERKLISMMEYRRANRLKLRAKDKAYSEKNREAINAKGRQRWAKFKEPRQQMPAGYMAAYARNRRASDPIFRIIGNLRSRRHYGLNRRTNGMLQYIGCTVLELRTHLECKFRSGMNWQTYGRKGWHVDHIRPLASFQFFNPDMTINEEELRRAMHFTNLQPLWYWENESKGSKFTVVPA